MNDEKKAFVLMPFDQEFNEYYQSLFKPPLEEMGYVVTRADDIYTPGPIIDDIRKSILEADILLCEMSGKNPNVFYELGLAHAIGKPAILISRKEDDIPFDLRHIRVILYDTTRPGWENQLRQSIISTVQAVSTPAGSWPPPLLPAIGGFSEGALQWDNWQKDFVSYRRNDFTPFVEKIRDAYRKFIEDKRNVPQTWEEAVHAARWPRNLPMPVAMPSQNWRERYGHDLDREDEYLFNFAESIQALPDST